MTLGALSIRGAHKRATCTLSLSAPQHTPASMSHRVKRTSRVAVDQVPDALQAEQGDDPKVPPTHVGSRTDAQPALHQGTPRADSRQPSQDNTIRSPSSDAITLPADLWRLRRLGPLDEEHVEIGPILGRGGYGKVFKGTNSVLCASNVFPSLFYESSTLPKGDPVIVRVIQCLS